jgi:hypothetical protein
MMDFGGSYHLETKHYLLEDALDFKQGDVVTITKSFYGTNIKVNDILVVSDSHPDITTKPINASGYSSVGAFLSNFKMGTLEELREHKLNSLID